MADAAVVVMTVPGRKEPWWSIQLHGSTDETLTQMYVDGRITLDEFNAELDRRNDTRGAVSPEQIVAWLRGRTGAHGGGFTSADDVADAIEREFVGPSPDAGAVGPSERETTTVRAAALLLGVHENTVRNWINAGRMEAHELPSGFKRPYVDEVARHLRGAVSDLTEAEAELLSFLQATPPPDALLPVLYPVIEQALLDLGSLRQQTGRIG